MDLDQQWHRYEGILTKEGMVLTAFRNIAPLVLRRELARREISALHETINAPF